MQGTEAELSSSRPVVDVAGVDVVFLGAGQETECRRWSEAAAEVAFEQCPPVRPFPVRKGKRLAPGWWWSATMRRLVHYGSGVMRTQVMLLDRDPAVVALACRPVEFTWLGRDGACVRHAPHLMARFSDGRGLLADCAGREEISQRLASRAAVVEAAAAAVGWQYRIARPPDRLLAANLGWLAGYRHPRYSEGIGARRIAEAFQQPRPLIEAVRELGDPAAVLPVVFHALWNGWLLAPLDEPLHERVVVSLGRFEGCAG